MESAGVQDSVLSKESQGGDLGQPHWEHIGGLAVVRKTGEGLLCFLATKVSTAGLCELQPCLISQP